MLLDIAVCYALAVGGNVRVQCSLLCIAGEFGIVYKARLGLSKREVAVKTLKGCFSIH